MATVRIPPLFFVLFVIPLGLLAVPVRGEAPPWSILHHELFVRLDPDQHALQAEDRLTVRVTQGQVPLRFELSPTLLLDGLALIPADPPTGTVAFEIPYEIEHGSEPHASQRVTIPSAAVTAGTMTIAVRYHGLVNDPPREPRHLRFVTPSETAGHIGSEGVYLSSESRWYLDRPGSVSTYRVQVALPEGWTAVTQAKPGERVACPVERCGRPGFLLSSWSQTAPAEALTLVANRFTVKTRNWTASNGQPVQLATYLFPDEARLADEYLDATARYLEAYITRLGPYPFDTFAVVENFFPSGLGMPSFTLLGSGVIKRHYVQPYALGHEIVHSWIGNSVFNRTDRGNWVEGLTTYLANYYWYELVGEANQAREQRRLMLRGYNLHVPPDRDYPVGKFTQKQDERDNAIGYQKAAMVFHLLRQEIGEQAFWSALQRLVRDYRGRHAEWSDLERLASEASGHELRPFFAQWVEGAGAPNLSIVAATVRNETTENPLSYRLRIRLKQVGTSFSFPLQLRVMMEGGSEQTVVSRLSRTEETVTAEFAAKPLAVELDPDAVLLRRAPRETWPPVLNHFVTDRRRFLIRLPPPEPSQGHPFNEVVQRLEAQERRRVSPEPTMTLLSEPDGLSSQEGSVLVLASPDRRETVQPLLNNHCGTRVQLEQDGLVLEGTRAQGAGIAALVTCHRRDRPGSVLTVFYAVTPQAAAPVARLLFFYGWHSYVLFQEGVVTTRGEWGTAERTEVVVDDGQETR